MRKYFQFLLFVLVVQSVNGQSDTFPFFTGQTSIRAMLADRDGSIWMSGTGGMVASYQPSGLVQERRIVFDTLKPDFRSMAETADAVFVLSAGSPALLYRVDKISLKARLVYLDASAGIFYDALKFTDDHDGLAIGDPIDGCFTVLTTHDGGSTWKKSSCDAAPGAHSGEVGFAASNSGLAVRGREVWFASGGKQARLFHSQDFGRHWETFETPVAHGSQMAGIFSMDVAGGEIVLAGGNYENLQNAEDNMAVSNDGGKTWKSVSTPFGYVSCIRYAADHMPGHWICATASGMYRTVDSGKTWQKLASGFFNVFVPGTDGWLYAGGSNIAARMSDQ